MKTWDELNASVGASTSGGSGGWDDLNEKAKQSSVNIVEKPMPETSPVKEEGGLLSKAASFGGSLFRKGMDAYNWVAQRQQRNELEIANRNREMMLEGMTKKFPDQAAEFQEKYKPYADYGSLVQDAPGVKLLNTKAGKAVTTSVLGGSSDITLKGLAALRAIGDSTFKEEYEQLMNNRYDEDRTAVDVIGGGVDSVIQSLIGLGATVGTYALTRNPYASGSVGTFYFGSLSAGQQVKEEGQVTSRGKILTDVAGDMVLGSLLSKMLAVPVDASTLKTVLSGAGIEGSTEVGQSIIKSVIDYGNAQNQEEKDRIFEELKGYFSSGAALEEFIVGGVAGGVSTAVVNRYSGRVEQERKTNIDIKNSFAFDVDKAIETGDVQRSDVYAGDGDTLTPKFAEGRVNDVAQKLATVDDDLATRYRTLVDAENTTMDEIISTGERVLAEYEAGRRAADINVIPSKEKRDRNKAPAQAVAESLGLGDEVNTFRDELGVLQADGGDVMSQRAQDLRDFFTDYTTAFNEPTTVIPDETGTPLITVNTVSFPDGKVAVKYAANTPFNSLAVDYNYSQLFGSKVEADAAALAAIAQWAEQQRTGGNSNLSVEASAAYQRILAAARNPNEAVQPIREAIERVSKRRAQKQQSREFQKQTRAEKGIKSSVSNAEMRAMAFAASENQQQVGNLGDVTITLGDYGRNNIARKIKGGKDQRVPLEALPETTRRISRAYVGGNRDGRKDSVVFVATMPDGTNRAIVTQKNRFGNEEVVSFFEITPETERDYAQFGSPDRSRTGILPLEVGRPNPLDDRSTTTVADATAGRKTTRKTQRVKSTDPKYQRVIKTVRSRGNYTSNEEAQAVIEQLLGGDYVAVAFADRILTGRGQDAWGRYWNHTITLINNPHWSTPYHESVHGYLDIFIEKNERQALFEAIREADNADYTDIEAEEAIADGFVEYVADGRTFTGRLKQFFDRVIDWIRTHFGLRANSDQPIREFYEKMLSGNRPNRDQFTVIEVGTDQLDILAMYQDARDFGIKFTNSPLLEGRDKFSYQFLKDSVRSGKFPINEKEQRFVNNVLDGNFIGRKDVTKDELLETIDRELLPLSVKKVGRYSNYGLDEANVGSDFAGEITRMETYVVGAGQVVAPFMDYKGRAHGFNDEDPGFMFHFRTAVTSENEGDVFNVVEIQSDPFQKGLFADDQNSNDSVAQISTSISENTEIPVARRRQISNLLNQAIASAQEGELAVVVNAAKQIKAAVEKTSPAKRRATLKLQSDLRALWDKLKTTTDPEARVKLVETFRRKNDEVLVHPITGALRDLERRVEEPNWTTETIDENYSGLELKPGETDSYTITPFNNALAAWESVFEAEAATFERAKQEYNVALENLQRLAVGELTEAERRGAAAIKRFREYENNWYELAVRTIVNTAARQGFSRVRLPSAFTVTQVEGWGRQVEGGAGIEEREIERADVGDTIYSHGYGDDYYVLEKAGDNRSFLGTTEMPDQRGSFDDLVEEEKNNHYDNWSDYHEDEIKDLFNEFQREKTVAEMLTVIDINIDAENKKLAEFTEQYNQVKQAYEQGNDIEISARHRSEILTGLPGVQTTRLRIEWDDLLTRTMPVPFSRVYLGRTDQTIVSDLTPERGGERWGGKRFVAPNDSDLYVAGIRFAATENEEIIESVRLEKRDYQVLWLQSTVNQNGTVEEAEQGIENWRKLVALIDPDARLEVDVVTPASGTGVAVAGYIIYPTKTTGENQEITNNIDGIVVRSDELKRIAREELEEKYNNSISLLTERSVTLGERISDYATHRAKVASYLEKTPETPRTNPLYNINVFDRFESGERYLAGAASFSSEEQANNYIERQKEIAPDMEYEISVQTTNPPEYVADEDDILSDFSRRLPGYEHIIDKVVDDWAKDFDAKSWLEDNYRYVYSDAGYFAVYNSEPDTIWLEVGDGDSTEAMDELRRDFESETNLKETNPNRRFGSLSEGLNGAAYRYEVDIPRYLNKYRKDKVEKEVAYGLSWFKYDVDPDVDGTPIPMYQVKSISDAVTFTTIERIKGRKTVSRQFIADQINRDDVKLAERQIMLDIYNTFDGDTINVPEFIKKAELYMLPLEAEYIPEPQFGYVHLESAKQGNAERYTEEVYTSPVNVDLKAVGHGKLTQVPNYFAHVRHDTVLEEGAQIRRVIELQSDLFQRDRLEAQNNMFLAAPRESFKERKELRDKEIGMLKPYRNLWHERVIREVVRDTATDGYAKLRFPTGATAMEIEGLGAEQSRWLYGGEAKVLTKDALELGLEIEHENSRESWVVVAVDTDLIGRKDGNFQAIEYRDIEVVAEKEDMTVKELVEDLDLRGKQSILANYAVGTERFSVATELDTMNPIYRFYENEVGKFLTRRYQATKVTDEKGVEWWEIVVPVDAANTPVPMYQLAPVGDGKEKQSRAYQRVSERLVEATETDANYNQMSIAKDTANALAYVKQQPIEASKVALGVLPPPEGVTETAVSIAVAEQALFMGNYELQAEVERSRSLRQTRRGQEIVAEKGRFNEDSPAHFIQRVLAARMEQLVAGYPRFPSIMRGKKKDGNAIIDRETAALKKELKVRLSKVAEAENFIKTLTC